MRVNTRQLPVDSPSAGPANTRLDRALRCQAAGPLGQQQTFQAAAHAMDSQPLALGRG